MWCIDFIATVSFYSSEDNQYNQFNMAKLKKIFFEDCRKLEDFTLQVRYMVKNIFVLFLHAVFVVLYIFH